MITETELREALQHSAARADRLDVREVARPRRRMLLPLAAAATVAALACGAAVLAREDGGRSASVPPAHVATATGSMSPTTAADQHVPVDIANAIDLFQVTHDDTGYYTIGGNGDPQVGTENFEKSIGGDRLLEVTIVDSSALDAARIPRAHPVAIARTTGYYAKLKLFPLDASTGPGSDKYSAKWTIAFRAPSGKWVFVWVENGANFDGVDDADTILAAYDAVGVRFAAGRTRLPFRTGYVPDGFRVDQIYAGYGESMTSLRGSDGRTIEIDVLHHRPAGQCVSTCGATRQVGTYTINVFADGYDASGSSVTGSSVKIPASGSATLTPVPTPVADALERRILDSLTLATDLSDPSTYWTIADALG